MFKWFKKNKNVEVASTKREELARIRQEAENYIRDYTQQGYDSYFKVSYYDTTCGEWKTTGQEFASRQDAQYACNSILKNCRSITPDLLKIVPCRG